MHDSERAILERPSSAGLTLPSSSLEGADVTDLALCLENQVQKEVTFPVHIPVSSSANGNKPHFCLLPHVVMRMK